MGKGTGQMRERQDRKQVEAGEWVRKQAINRGRRGRKQVRGTGEGDMSDRQIHIRENDPNWPIHSSV